MRPKYGTLAEELGPLLRKKESDPRPPVGPVVVVDFEGYGDLYRRVMIEAEKCRETVGDHLLWLAGVYIRELDR